MKRLLLWVIILTTLFSGGIAVAGHRGIGAPKPAFAQWFTYPDGTLCPMPCLFGIRPGVTMMNEVDAILKAHPHVTNLQPDFENDEIGAQAKYYQIGELPLNLVVSRENNSTLIDLVHIIPPTRDGHLTTTYDLFVSLGIPQQVDLSDHPDSNNRFIYADETVFVSAIDTPECLLHLDAKVFDIYFYMPGYYAALFTARSANTPKPVFPRWAGFAKRAYDAVPGQSQKPCTP
jgi:hypothetical protein